MATFVQAQEVKTSDYYYNDFEDGTFLTSSGGNWIPFTSTAISQSVVLSSGAVYGGGSYNLTSNKTATPVSNSYAQALATPFSFAMANTDPVYEWSFLYKATVLPVDDASATTLSTKSDAWKFWLVASTANGSTADGYYLTQKSDGKLYLVRKSGTTYTQIANTTALTANVPYNIKVQRIPSGGQVRWRIYFGSNVLDAVQSTQTPSGGGINEGNSTYVTSYNNTILESVTKTQASGNYQWDVVKMYKRKVSITANNNGPGVNTAPLYTGESNVVIASFGINAVTVMSVNSIRINVSGALNATFSSMTLVRSLDNSYLTTADNSPVTGASINSNASPMTITSIAEISNNSPTYTTPIPPTYYYFLIGTVANSVNNLPISFTLSFSGTGGNLLTDDPSGNTNLDVAGFTSVSLPSTSVGKTYDWVGNSGLNYNWATATNWSPSTPNGGPTATDLARIGANNPFISTPIVNAAGTAGNVIMGTASGVSPGITVNSTLTVAGDLTYQSDNSSANSTTFAAFLNTTGTGTVNTNNLNIIASSPLTFNYTETLKSSVTNLNINNNLSLTTSLTLFAGNPNFLHNAVFNLTGGTAKLIGIVQTTNVTGTTSPTSTVAIIPTATATLQLANAAALSGLSALGNNVIDLDNTGAIVEYSGNTQVVYTDANITGLTGGVNYQNIKFSTGGVKTPNGGNLNVAGDFTNNAGASSNLLLTTTPVIFNGTTQALSNASGTTTLFNNVTFQGGGTKTMSGSGNFNVGSTGTVTMAGSSTLAAGGVLTLKSSSSGTGRVDKIPSTAKITGNVTVERYFTGGLASNRGWRLMSMPVNNTATVPASSTALFNFSSLKTNLYITGTGTNFDATSGPTILFYNTATKTFTYPSDPTTNSGAVGTGFYFYFRGDKSTSVGKLAKTGSPLAYAVPESNVVGLQTGSLNQQGFTVTLSNAGNGFNLVGNPYASTITMPSGGGTIGSSAPYNRTTGFVYTYTSGGTSVSAEPTSVNIASGQGFFVKTATTGTGAYTVAFAENLKSSAQVTSGLLLGKPVGTEQPILSIKMVQDSANYDIAHLRFLDTYKNEYDEMEDADDINGSGQNAFLGVMTLDNHQVAIASQPLDKKKTSVFLNVNDNYSGLYTLQKMNLSGIPDVYDVWLMDHFKNDSLDLRANNTYKFNLDKNNPQTFGAARFEILIRKKSLPPYELVSFNGQRNGADVQLKWNVKNEFNYTSFELQRSTDGINFEAVKNMQSSSQGAYNFNDIYTNNTTSTLYYRLKQVDIDDVVHFSAVVVVTATKGSGIFTVYPNPATNTIQFNLSDETLKASSLRLSIFNTMGLLMKSSTYTATTTGQQDVSSLTPGNYTIEITDLKTKKPILTGKFIKL